ncbi:DUF134 domain-containing protein [Puteibacter caeruleilacunae]|nr:DUF134 domain-containing protein [Puteibacter caeruleilacunae]
MPRRRRLRKIVAPPSFKGYKPYGHRRRNTDSIELNYEEYEAIKLADYDLMNHAEASVLMGVSRATFARIYETARRKIAAAFVECKEIKTVFGNATLQGNWYHCVACNARFTIPNMTDKAECPMCKKDKIEPIKTAEE